MRSFDKGPLAMYSISLASLSLACVCIAVLACRLKPFTEKQRLPLASGTSPS